MINPGMASSEANAASLVSSPSSGNLGRSRSANATDTLGRQPPVIRPGAGQCHHGCDFPTPITLAVSPSNVQSSNASAPGWVSTAGRTRTMKPIRTTTSVDLLHDSQPDMAPAETEIIGLLYTSDLYHKTAEPLQQLGRP